MAERTLLRLVQLHRFCKKGRYKGGWLSSDGFKPSRNDGRVSVLWEDKADEKFLKDYLNQLPGFEWDRTGYAELRVSEVKGIPGFSIQDDPIDADPLTDTPANPAHAQIVPPAGMDEHEAGLRLWAVARAHSSPPLIREEGLASLPRGTRFQGAAKNLQESVSCRDSKGQ